MSRDPDSSAALAELRTFARRTLASTTLSGGILIMVPSMCRLEGNCLISDRIRHEPIKPVRELAQRVQVLEVAADCLGLDYGDVEQARALATRLQQLATTGQHYSGLTLDYLVVLAWRYADTLAIAGVLTPETP